MLQIAYIVMILNLFIEVGMTLYLAVFLYVSHVFCCCCFIIICSGPLGVEFDHDICIAVFTLLNIILNIFHITPDEDDHTCVSSPCTRSTR